MSRIIVEDQVTLRREAVAPYITITWSLDDTGAFEFHVQHAISVNGVHTRMEPETRQGLSPMRFTLDELMPRVFAVELPDGSTQNVPVGLVMLTMKAAFDQLYTERLDELDAADAAFAPLEPTEPQPTP